MKNWKLLWAVKNGQQRWTAKVADFGRDERLNLPPLVGRIRVNKRWRATAATCTRVVHFSRSILCIVCIRWDLRKTNSDAGSGTLFLWTAVLMSDWWIGLFISLFFWHAVGPFGSATLTVTEKQWDLCEDEGVGRKSFLDMRNGDGMNEGSDGKRKIVLYRAIRTKRWEDVVFEGCGRRRSQKNYRKEFFFC